MISFNKLINFFRPKKEIKNICNHTHADIYEFLKSFNDEELNLMRSELIGCNRNEIPEHIQNILLYLKDRCTKDDFDWIYEEINKEYKNNNSK